MLSAKKLRPAFQHRQYLFRSKVFRLFGGAFHVYDENGSLVLYSKQKAFKLREDFQVYSGEHQMEDLLTIKPPRAWILGQCIMYMMQLQTKLLEP